jgi:hypothetical protein
MKSLGKLMGLASMALAAACVACTTFGGAKKGEEAKNELLLEPIRTKHRYVMPSDLPQVQLRVALVDTAWGEKSRSTVTVGMFRPHDGLFRVEVDPVTAKSIQSVVAAVDKHIDRMPVGIILTSDGKLPGAGGSQPPAAFGAFVSALQDALGKEGIQFTFVLPNELHVVR